MARGHQKFQSQQKNAKKLADSKKSKSHDQKAAAKAALVYTCTICRVCIYFFFIDSLSLWRCHKGKTLFACCVLLTMYRLPWIEKSFTRWNVSIFFVCLFVLATIDGIVFLVHLLVCLAGDPSIFTTYRKLPLYSAILFFFSFFFFCWGRFRWLGKGWA